VVRIAAPDAWVVREVFERGEYAGVPAAALRSPPVVLDVGANAGVFALFAKLHYHRGAAVHCFEPYPPSVELLRQNLSGFDMVTVHPFALSDRDGQADLHLHADRPVAHSLVPGLVAAPAGRMAVPVREAARVWDELGLTEVDVLKLDTEGCEVPILESLGRRVSAVRAVLVEFHSRADRRRIDALLPGHDLVGAVVYGPDRGVLRYLRSDLAGDRRGLPD
jgi:FkbM family methyltransferase